MDESHRYRASAGVRGITELKPSAYSCAVQEPPADYRVPP
jgi:hypothetical protein